MSELLEKHIELVKMVNSADSELQHRLAQEKLSGFRLALKMQGINQMMDCDWHYIDKGIERPMCCGVFLDWQPSI